MNKIVSILLAVLLVSMTSMPILDVYGHGLGKAEVGPKNVGDKLISMHVEIEPEMKKVDELKDVKLSIEVSEHISEEEEQVIPGIAVNLKIYKFRTNELLLDENFHVMSDVETLEILFKPSEERGINIKGMKMGHLDI